MKFINVILEETDEDIALDARKEKLLLALYDVIYENTYSYNTYDNHEIEDYTYYIIELQEFNNSIKCLFDNNVCHTFCRVFPKPAAFKEAYHSIVCCGININRYLSVCIKYF